MDQILELLDAEVNSGNAIFLVKKESGTVVGGNQQANAMFSKVTDVFDFSQILGEENTLENLLETAKKELETQETFTVSDIFIATHEGEKLPCNLDFTYITQDQTSLLLIVKLVEDLRPKYLEMLLKKSKRPTFLLDFEEHMVIRAANDAFYSAFACTRENIDEKYENYFDNLLNSENREEYISDIYQGLNRNSSAILDVQVQIATGEDLLFYFSKEKAKDFLEEGDVCLFCQLVGANETFESVDSPYDVAH